MFLTIFSNKGSKAPLIYLIIQALVIWGLITVCPSMINLSQHHYVLFFWADVILTIAFFFYVHRTDPGYVPYDGVFFTEQDDARQSANRSKYESMVKLKNADSSMQFPHIGFSPTNASSAAHHLGYGTTLSPATSTAISKNALQTLNSPAPQQYKLDDNTDGSPKNYQTGGSSNPNEGHELGDVLPIEEEEGDHEKGAEEDAGEVKINLEQPEEFVMECQFSEENRASANPSMNFDNSPSNAKAKAFGQGEPGISQGGFRGSFGGNGKYQPQLDDVHEEAEENNTQKYTNGKEGGSIEDANNLSVLNMDELRHESQAKQQQLETKASDKSNKANKTQHLPGKINFMNYQAMRDRFSINEVSGQLEIKLSDLQNAPEQTNAKPKPLTSKVTSYLKNLCIVTRLFDRAREIKLETQAMEEQQKTKMGKDVSCQLDPSPDLESVYIERRYCTGCNLDQPLRSKHCKSCNRCIGRYDHHCPWLGTCIGEKNHLVFYVYLIFQVVEILWGEVTVLNALLDSRATQNSPVVWKVILMIITTFFTAMVGSLVMFHTYLATQNMTTWEFLSWNRISYLKEWQMSWGSPFSKGSMDNLKYFFTRKRELSRWKMPKSRGVIDKQLQEIKA